MTITVPIQGYLHDAAFWQSGELTATGVLGATVYTDGSHAYPATVVDEILAAGLAVLFNHENAPMQLGGGASAGVAAASAACAAVVGYGCPQDGSKAIYYSVDGNPPSSQYPVYAAAFTAIRQVHAGRFLVGFYGALALHKYLWSLGLLDVKCWLSGSSSFAGYNPNDPDVGLVQLVGTDVPNTDRDAVIDLNGLGVWMTQVDLTPAAIAAVAQAAQADVWGQLGAPLPAEPGGALDPNWSVNVPAWEFLTQIPAQFAEVKKQLAALTTLVAAIQPGAGSTPDQIAEATVNLMAGVPIISTIGAKS